MLFLEKKPLCGYACVWG